jgi:2-desacetyl-2-hydroxyethyl bacteriochlorophyllide A dehydrogenase
MKARCVVFASPRVVEVRDAVVGDVGEGDVLVETLYSGISAGTELLAYRGDLDPQAAVDEALSALHGTFAYPFRYGYSCVGRIVRSRSQLAEGDVVFAFHPHQDRFIVPAAEAIPVDQVPPRLATLFPLVETALQVSLDAGAVTHEPVVVLGLGAIGLLTAALLARAGATVIAVEPRPWRREAAAAFPAFPAAPAVEAIDPAKLEDAVRERTDGRGVPLLVEASGSPNALATGLGLLAQEGTALVASWYGTKPAALPLGDAFHRRRLTIRSSQVSTIPAELRRSWTIHRRRAVACRLLAELPLDVLATHEFPLAQAPEAFAALDRGDAGMLHVALSYGDQGG